MKQIEREYVNRLIGFMNTPDIKVIIGIKRSGKRSIINSLIEYICLNYSNYNIIHIDFNDIEFEHLKEYHALNNYVKENYKSEKTNFLFIDEVQMCPNFEKTINSLHTSEKFDIYITGSNAFLLSSDLATLFTGRTMELEVFPFSYKEYCTYFDRKDIIDSFDYYINDGGLSGSYLHKDEMSKYKYITNVYNTIIERDLLFRKKLRNKELLLNISSYLMDNIYNLTSSNNITNYLNDKKIDVTDKTVGNYIDSLCNSFLFYKISRYDIKGKKYLSTNSKYYLSEHTFKYAILGKKDMDYGRIYENIVAIELLRRGYEVYVGVLYKKEIDFVAIKRDEKIYIQVSYDISNKDTFKRETDSLLKIKDAYPKMIITRTKQPSYLHEGIEIVDIALWLYNI